MPRPPRHPRHAGRALVALLLATAVQAGVAAPLAAASAGVAVVPGAARVVDGTAATRQVVVTWTRAELGGVPAIARTRALRDPERLARLEAAAGSRVELVRAFGRDGRTGVYRLGRALGGEATATIRALNHAPGVDLAEPDPIAVIDALPDDPFANQLWGQLGPADGSPYGMDAVGAWATSTGVGTVVAVIDTGIRAHVDLAANLVAGYDMISDAWTANDGTGRDADPTDPGDFVTADDTAHCSVRNSSWHGTHVGGIVAAVPDNAIGVFGAAPSAQVQPIRVLGRCGGTFSDIADAVTWASGGTVSGVPANPTPADVANLSIGSTSACPQFMVAAVAAARSRGMVTVASAGNGGVDASLSAPANCPGVVAVAAIDSAGTRAIFDPAHPTSSSNYGSVVDVAAPGKGIISTWNGGTTTPGADAYGNGSGTSQAAPHVAALAALLRAARPGAQPAALERAITSSAKAFATDADPLGCPTAGCGAGIADAPAALAFLATADIAAPNAAITPPAGPTKAASLVFSIGFDEAVTGLAAADLAAGGTATGCAIGAPAGSGTAWTATLTGCTDGTVTLALAAQGVQDAVANVGPDAAVTSAAVLVDRTAPTSAGSIAPVATNGTVVTVGYTASDGAGVGVASVQASYSASASLASATACGSVTSSAPTGTITCTLPAIDATYRVFTRATDALGTTEAAPATADDTVIRDTVPPGAVLVPASAASRTGSMAFTLTWAEAVAGLTAGDLTVGGTAVGCVLGGLVARDDGLGASITVTGCGDGMLAVQLQAGAATDAAGNAGPPSAVTSATVTMDTVPPAVGVPSIVPRTNVALAGTAIPVTLTWTGADNIGGSGIASYALQRSLDGGSTWATIATGLTATTRATTVPSSGTARFRVIATDRAGNAATGGARAISGRLVQNTSSAIHYSSPWSLVSSASYSGGSARATSTAGRSASYTFTGRGVALVATRSSTRGKARIYVSGVYVATVDLYRSSGQYRSVVWQRTWSSTTTKTIRVVVVGTSGRPRVDLDAFVVLR